VRRSKQRGLCTCPSGNCGKRNSVTNWAGIRSFHSGPGTTVTSRVLGTMWTLLIICVVREVSTTDYLFCVRWHKSQRVVHLTRLGLNVFLTNHEWHRWTTCARKTQLLPPLPRSPAARQPVPVPASLVASPRLLVRSRRMCGSHENKYVVSRRPTSRPNNRNKPIHDDARTARAPAERV
jgi:hypothetical protein